MTRHIPQPGIPCGVKSWTPLPNDGYRAEPCGHTLDEIGTVFLAELARLAAPDPG